MLKLIIFALMFPFLASANQAYRCTDEKGQLSFQAQPCEGGSGERVTLPSAPAVGWQQEVETAEQASQRRQLEALRDSQLRSEQNYRNQIREIDNRRCQYYQDQLKSAQERWATAQKRGYTYPERDRLKQSIADRERDVNRNC